MADILQEALDDFDTAMEADRENRLEAVTDLQFLAGEQWDAATRADRAGGDGRSARPMLVFNQMPEIVNQVANDIRQNPPAIKIRPVDAGADAKAAELRNGILRNIEAQSGAERAYTMAAESAVACGWGAFRVTADYTDDDGGWDQDIRIEGIRDPFSVVFDPDAREQTRADARYCFVSQLYTRKAFEAEWPDAAPEDWDRFLQDCTSTGEWWSEGDRVRVAEYWTRKEVTKTLLQLQDGSTRDASGVDKAQLEQWRFDGLILRERKVRGWKVRQHLLSAKEELAPAQDWVGRYIPIIPVVGQEVQIGERTVRRGIIRGARDAQRMKNLHRSTLAEQIALAPKAKIVAALEQIEGHEKWWNQANTGSFPVLPYNPTPNAQPPAYLPPPMPSQALMQDLAMAVQDIETTTGVHPANLGMDGKSEESGRAIISRQRKGQVGSYHYRANLEVAVAHCGRVILDILPHYYDTARVVRVLGEDGAVEFAPINQPIYGPDGKAQLLNDMSAGRYDVVASTGPSYATRREEEREGIIATMQAVPQIAQAAPDLVVGAMDWPGSEEFRKRLRKTLPPGLAEPEEGDPPPAPPAPDPNMVLAQAEMAKAQAANQQAQIKAQQAQAEVQVKQIELQIEQQRLDLERAKLGITQGAEVAKATNAAKQTQLKGIEVAGRLMQGAREHHADMDQRRFDNERTVVEHADRRVQREQDVEHRTAEFQQRASQPPQRSPR
ncbi:portal protein [Roseomonas gilardii]|uniref:Portal protein n=1 Tax=Roseomonas gilardii TaxID=257708 RepID=A0ABU3MJ11_9PROT|nr:portal protein [Roseomonas gilardii]MDT8333004.1 portal protein [Roseomonas gilardii]